MYLFDSFFENPQKNDEKWNQTQSVHIWMCGNRAQTAFFDIIEWKPIMTAVKVNARSTRSHRLIVAFECYRTNLWNQLFDDQM